MLYAASVKIVYKNNQRRLDLVVEAENPAEAENKALKQARKMFCPNKKTTYNLITLIDETEALETFSQSIQATSNKQQS